MKKNILALGMVLALVAVLVMPTAALATNTGTQNASIAQATTILIVSKTDNSTVTSITFPVGLPGATISNPYNNVDASDPQVLSGSVSEPVVKLKNSSAGTLTIWLSITNWTNSVVTSEDYELVATTNTTAAAVATVLSADGLAASVSTGQTMDADTYKALYLEVVLNTVVAAKASTSTLSILGES